MVTADKPLLVNVYNGSSRSLAVIWAVAPGRRHLAFVCVSPPPSVL